MCTQLTSKWKTADHDIVVYGLKKEIQRDEVFKSLCFPFLFTLNKKYTASGKKEQIKGTVYKGMFHLAKYKKSLIPSVISEEWCIEYLPAYLIVRGYIPEGTKYAEGITKNCSPRLDGIKAYVAKKVVWTNVVYRKLNSQRRRLL